MAKEDLSDLLTRKEFEQFKTWIMDKFKAMYLDIKDVEAYRSPLNHEGKFDSIFEIINKHETQLASMRAKVASYIIEGKFLELFEDIEIQNLFAQSGLGLKDVADKFKITIAQASNYAKGNIDNLTVRNQLGKWFREECIKNKENIRKS